MLEPYRVLVDSCPLCIEGSFSLPEASVYRDLGNLLSVSFDDAIYPILDFTGHTIAVA